METLNKNFLPTTLNYTRLKILVPERLRYHRIVQDTENKNTEEEIACVFDNI